MLWVNAAMCRLLQRSRDELLGATWQEITHPDDLQVDLALVNEVLAGRRDSYQKRKRFVLPNGDTVLGSLNVSCLRDADGEVTVFIGQVVDLTEEVARERELLHDLELYSAAVEHHVEPMLLLEAVRDEQGAPVDVRVLGANARARDCIKLPASGVKGRTLSELVQGAAQQDWWRYIFEVDLTGISQHVNEVQWPSLVADNPQWFSYDIVKTPRCIAVAWRKNSRRNGADSGGERPPNGSMLEESVQFRLLLENSADVVFHSTDGILRWVSPSASEVLGETPDELIGKSTVQYWHPDDRELAMQLRDAAIAGHSGRGTLRWRRPDESYVWLDVAVRPMIEPDGSTGMVGSLRDISDQVEAQQDLARLIGHDVLTGLTTRIGMLEVLAGMLRGARAAGRQIAVLCVAVDRLSAVNDVYGHTSGDVVLVQFARKIVEAVGGGAHVTRGSGVDFLVAVETEALDVNSVSVLAERIRAALSTEVKVNRHVTQITASIGVAIANPSSSPESLVDAATLAMSHAKELGRDRVVFADPEYAARVKHRTALLDRARIGLTQGEFVPMYMPIVELATNKLRGYEALARWRRPDGSIWEPAAFLSAMESTLLICDLDLAILRQSLAALQCTPASMFMSVNISARTLSTPSYREALLEVVTSTKELRGPLHLEITETALLELTSDVLASMSRMTALGVRWYVDDFGVGYSSISHLRDLPIDGIKLDMSFTRGVGTGDDTSIRVSQALAGLARGLGLDTVAAGVEGPRQAAALAEHGWHLGQGWLFGSAVVMNA